MKNLITATTSLLLLLSSSGIAQVTNGLTSKYSFSNNTNDDVGINHLTSNNPTPVFGQDRFGNPSMAFNCDGISDYLKTTTPFFNPANPYTISIWFRTDDSLRNKQTLMNTDPHRHMCVGYNYYNNNTFDVGLGDGVNWTTCMTYNNLDTLNASTVAVTKWSNFIITYDGTQWKYYIDAVYNKTCSGGTPVADTADMWFGTISEPGFAFLQLMQGQLDDITIYDRALGQQDVDSVYNEPNPTTTSVQDFKNNDETLFYPNPAKNIVHFINPQNITLSNINGQVIYKGNFVTDVDVSALISGIYFLQINDHKGNVVKVSKLVKE